MANKFRWKKLVDPKILPIVITLVATIVAGIWAVYTYFKKEMQEQFLYAKRVEFNGKLTWFDISNDFCQADYELEFKNIGKVPVTVGHSRVSAGFLRDEPKANRITKVELIDPLKIPLESESIPRELTERLEGVYGPDERVKTTFSFFVPRTLGKKVLFKVALWAKNRASTTRTNQIGLTFTGISIVGKVLERQSWIDQSVVEQPEEGDVSEATESDAAMNIGEILIWESSNLLLLIPAVIGLVMVQWCCAW